MWTTAQNPSLTKKSVFSLPLHGYRPPLNVRDAVERQAVRPVDNHAAAV